MMERERVPRPLIGRRLPSGRGASEQPNAGSETDVRLSLRFWVLVVGTGVAAGLFGDLMMVLLNAVEHLAFGYQHGSFGAGVEAAAPGRRVLALAIGGLIGGLGWFTMRKLFAGHKTDLDDEVWTGTGQLRFRRSLMSSTMQEIIVGSGASLGREAAPKLLGGVAGSVLATRFGLTPAQRRLLVACGAGAGMAAVYNVPLGGALITAELLYGSLTLPVILPALATAWIATAVSWLYLPDRAVYRGVPSYPLRASHVVFALVAGPVIGLLAVAFIRMIGLVSHHQLRGRAVLVAPLAAFTLLGVLAMRYPQLLGNGLDVAQEMFRSTGAETLVLLLALMVLKPLVTAMCLGSGVTGGLFTPTLATGALVGAALGKVWLLVWPGAALGSYALIGAAAMIGAAMQTPLAALALVLELTHTAESLMVPMIAATVLATAVARYVDGYSIYSSRLPARASSGPPREAERSPSLST